MKIAILGCGNMGAAMAKQLSSNHQVHLYDRHLEKTQELVKNNFGKSFDSVQKAVEGCEWIIIAVKPQNLLELSKEIQKAIQKDQNLVSLLAGTSLMTLKGLFPSVPIYRLMPNLAIIYGDGAIGVSADHEADQSEKKRVEEVFKVLGKIYWVAEAKMNALTALAGSGPAFVFALVEAMIDAGIVMGLSAKESQELTYQMVKGSVSLLEHSEQHPGELKWKIASPGGTTIAGLRKFEERGLRGGMMDTVLAAYERAQELQ